MVRLCPPAFALTLLMIAPFVYACGDDPEQPEESNDISLCTPSTILSEGSGPEAQGGGGDGEEGDGKEGDGEEGDGEEGDGEEGGEGCDYKCAPVRVSGFCSTDYVFPPGFYGLYTKLDSGEPWEEAARTRTGDDADVIVHFDSDRQLVFWRASSYLPFWKTENSQWSLEELVPRQGDGPSAMPDLINRYSHVRLIENSADRVVVHWRYFPSMNQVDWDGAVDELFTITPDGKVTRAIRQGTEKIDDWNDPENVTVQELELLPGGINELSLTPAAPQGLLGAPVAGNPLGGMVVGNPVAAWTFDEGLEPNRDVTVESASGSECVISGPKSLWRAGVSGSALQHDGEKGGVTLSADLAPTLNAGMSVEAWIAPAALPQIDWAPIVHQSDWGVSGYYLGINPQGHLGFHAAIGGKWRSLVDPTPVRMRRWQHVAASYDPALGRMTLYMDGEPRGTMKVPAGAITGAALDVAIGNNNRPMPAAPGPIALSTYPTWFGFDGLIDEVRIHDVPLSAKQVSQSVTNFSPGESVTANPDLPIRRFPIQALPGDAAADSFGAEYARFEYHDAWDNLWRVGAYPDVLIRFDEAPVRMAFWHGTSYGPAFITENGRWVGDQSSENFKEAGEEAAEGSCEHMSDKQTRHSHVRIIESTPARVVVHWRYGQVDSRYVFSDVDPETSWGDWADEYWTFYPDAVAVRYLERGKIWDGSWTETLVYNQPGEFPEDNIEVAAYTAANADGDERTYSWEAGAPRIDLPGAVIGMVNTKSRFRPFHIVPSGSEITPYEWDASESSSHTLFSWYNHYPVSQLVSGGWDAEINDHATHSSLIYHVPGSNDYLLWGLTDQPASSLVPLFRSWDNPAPLSSPIGGVSQGFDKAQRAYVLSLATGASRLAFDLEGTADSPIVNPALVIKRWASDSPAALTVDGQRRAPGADFRQGITREMDGTQSLVIWLRENAIEPRSLVISR